jgi:hypothetical protein
VEIDDAAHTYIRTNNIQLSSNIIHSWFLSMLHYQKQLQPPPSGALASLQIQLLGVGEVALEACGDHLHYLLYALPGGVLCGDHRAVDHLR